MKFKLFVLLWVTLFRIDIGLLSQTNFSNANTDNMDLWRKDSNGCKGYREKIYRYIYDNQNSIYVGKTSAEVIRIFGKPDKVDIYEDPADYTYYYNVNCFKASKRIIFIFMFVDRKVFGIDIAPYDSG